jgi:hypothetical protein
VIYALDIATARGQAAVNPLPEGHFMRNSFLLGLLILFAAACGSNKSENNPRPETSVHGTLDSAANRVVRDTADTTAHPDTTTSR